MSFPDESSKNLSSTSDKENKNHNIETLRKDIQKLSYEESIFELETILSNVQDAENHLEGVLYNEYSLGSRFQYQVRVGDNVFTIEKLRENRFSGKLDDKVLIGWDIKDSIVVEENQKKINT